jgi:hypothetical protein
MSSPLGLGLATAGAGGSRDYRLDIGSVLSRTFTVWLANLLPFVLVGLVVQSPVFLALAAMAALGAENRIVQTLLEPLSSLLTLIMTGAVTYGVFESLRDKQVGVGDVLRTGLSRLGTVFITGLLTGLGMLVGFCALVVPGLILLVRWWVAVPAAVIEGAGASAAMDRSVSLTEGNRWHVLALALIIGVIGYASTFAVGALVGMIDGSMVAIGTSEAAWVPWAQALVHVGLLPFVALAAVMPAIVYHDLRVGKEGVDVDELLRVFE